MDYELAKKLKDAGFPQDKSQFYFGAGYRTNDKTIYDVHYCKEKIELRTWLEYVACPTLSELIDVCGEEFAELRRLKDGWEAIAKDPTDGLEILFRNGKTPEIAVANLWLVLNKK